MRMNTNWSGRRALGVALAITAIAFAAGMAALFLAWGFLRLLGDTSDVWAMIEAVATALAAATVFGAGVFAYLELAEQSKGRYITVADRLFDELNEPENVRARRWVFQHLPPDPAVGLAQMSEDELDRVKRVLNSLDRVAFLTQAGWIPDDLILPWMNAMVVKAWVKLQPYVDYEAARRNEPDYYRQVRRLAERCVAWRQAHLPDAQTTWVDHAL
jgi:hypothetical protein